MLSAAHVLAMDAKNLLDVVDSIRVRFSQLISQKGSPPISTTTSSSNLSSSTSSAQAINILSSSATSVEGKVKSTQRFMSQTSQDFITTPQTPSQTSSTTNEEGYQIMCGQSYANFPQVQNNSFLFQHTSPPSSLTLTGIYDNESVINQQMKNLELSSSNEPLTKPIIASKPANLQQRLMRSNSLRNSQEKNTTSLDEPLKIVEDSSDLYCNSSAAIKIPEKINCTAVQENMFNSQSVMNNKLG